MDQTWPEGKRAAVTLCYDGGLASQLNLQPLLDELDIHATFFLSPSLLLENPQGWQGMATCGHEIGSHSLYGVTEHGALFVWNRQMVGDDVDFSNDLFRELFGKAPRSFALPGWSTHCAEGDYLLTVQDRFAYVRSDRRESNDPRRFDPKFLGSFPLDMPAVDLAGALTVGIKQGHWIILRVDRIPDDHEALITTLAIQEDLWIAPMSQVGDWLSPLNRNATVR